MNNCFVSEARYLTLLTQGAFEVPFRQHKSRRSKPNYRPIAGDFKTLLRRRTEAPCIALKFCSCCRYRQPNFTPYQADVQAKIVTYC